MRPRLHHLGQRLPGGSRPRPGRHGQALRHCRDARHRELQSVLRLDLPLAPQPAGGARVAPAAGPLGARPPRVPRAAPRAVRRPRVLHLPLRPDGDGNRHRAVQEPARADGARRAGHPPGHLPGRLRRGGGHRRGTPSRTPLRVDPLPPARARRGRRRLRRGPAGGRGDCRGRGSRCRRAVEPRATAAPPRGARPTPSAAGTGLYGPFLLYGGRIDPRQGLRGAARVLPDVPEGGRRRHACADGRPS